MSIRSPTLPPDDLPRTKADFFRLKATVALVIPLRKQFRKGSHCPGAKTRVEMPLVDRGIESSQCPRVKTIGELHPVHSWLTVALLHREAFARKGALELRKRLAEKLGEIIEADETAGRHGRNPSAWVWEVKTGLATRAVPKAVAPETHPEALAVELGHFEARGRVAIRPRGLFFTFFSRSVPQRAPKLTLPLLEMSDVRQCKAEHPRRRSADQAHR
jgi:hypothetical protein